MFIDKKKVISDFADRDLTLEADLPHSTFFNSVRKFTHIPPHGPFVVPCAVTPDNLLTNANLTLNSFNLNAKSTEVRTTRRPNFSLI